MAITLLPCFSDLLWKSQLHEQLDFVTDSLRVTWAMLVEVCGDWGGAL